ncbi:MAG: PEP-CTERM sorting domain-containing protein [Pirellulales bacterium]|nr:PEP-CTERM sorting domain-containing protein [Pirellulales bacterium]
MSVFYAGANAQIIPDTNPDTILGDYPLYVDAILPGDYDRFLEPALVNTVGGDLALTAWRYSDTVGGIVKSENLLDSAQTALIVVNPLGIEDGQGWGFPQAYNNKGYAFLGTLPDNQHYNNQLNDVVKGFVYSTRGRVPLVMYGMPGESDSTRYQLYRDYTHQPSLADQSAGQVEIESYLSGLTGTDWPDKIPVAAPLQYQPGDVVAYDDPIGDGQGYNHLKSYLQSFGITNILLAGYAADTDLATATAGYMNLKNDFNIFVVGDAAMSAWPVTTSVPSGYTRVSTRDAVIAAAGVEDVAVTQVSWIEQLARDPAGGPTWRGEQFTCMAEWNNWQTQTGGNDPTNKLNRSADYWETTLHPDVFGSDHFADEFDVGKIELLGTLSGHTNVVKINSQQELTLHLPSPAENLADGEVLVQITWLPDNPGQEPVWTLDLHNGAPPPGGDVTMVRESRLEDNGWFTDIYSFVFPEDAESTILKLGFGNESASVDSIVVDMKMGMPIFPGDANHDGRVDEIDATLLASNWNPYGGIGNGTPVAGSPEIPGDFNGDGWVDSEDAAILAANWMKTAILPADATSIPEPSTAGLLCMVIVALLTTRRGQRRAGSDMTS